MFKFLGYIIIVALLVVIILQNESSKTDFIDLRNSINKVDHNTNADSSLKPINISKINKEINATERALTLNDKDGALKHLNIIRHTVNNNNEGFDIGQTNLINDLKKTVDQLIKEKIATQLLKDSNDKATSDTKQQ